MFSADDLAHRLRELTPASARGFVVGLSGGADSLALLHAAVAAAAQLRLPLRALHVDHGLQAAAARFIEAATSASASLGVPCRVLKVSLPDAAGRSVEELAREARYAALAADLRPRECLLTAHHQDDQAETFLLQALRGAGLAGLAAMPVSRPLGAGWHLRPLLDVSRASLRARLAGSGLAAAEDAMNVDRRFDRAYLRQEVWPALQRRWPAAGVVLSRSAAHLAVAQADGRVQACRDLARVRDGGALAVPALRRLSPPHRAAALRAFIEAAGARPPPQARLEEALRQILEARADAQPSIRWASHALRRYRDRLYLTAAEPPAVRACSWPWREEATCELGRGVGILSWRGQPGGLDPQRLPPVIEVRPRAGGEVLRAARGGVTHDLRHLLQERGVVPWARSQLPLLWSQGTLLAAADLWMNADYCVAAGEAGLCLRWESAPCID